MKNITNSDVLRFIAGSPLDPRPEGNLEKRQGRCLTCDGLVIVHYSAPYWISGDGQIHGGHQIEFPREWLLLGERDVGDE